MAPRAAITTHSYIVETDGDESRCCSDEDGSLWARRAPPAGAADAGLQPAVWPLPRVRTSFRHLRYFQAFLFPLLDSASQQMWPRINNLCLNRLRFLRAPYWSLRPSSWTDRPLLGWRAPRNAPAWGGYDALALRCWKAWRSAIFPQCSNPSPHIPAALLNYTWRCWEKLWKSK